MSDASLARTGAARWPFYYGWVNLALAAVAMVATLPGRTQGLGLVTEPLLRDLALDRETFAGGAFAVRGSMRRLLGTGLVLLALSLAALPHVATAFHVTAYAVVMGVAGGFVIVVFFTFWGKAFGRAHLGRIQGAAQILTVLASAVGPFVFARCRTTTGSYAPAFYALGVVVAALALAAFVVRVPPGAEPGRAGA